MDYRYLEKMTDETGFIQFGVGDEPNLESGHTVDDNARALLVSLNMEGDSRERLALLYARYLKDALRPDGRWRNLLVRGRYLADLDSGDCQGRGFLACSIAASCDLEEVSKLAQEMLEGVLPTLSRLEFPRSRAYALLGLIRCTELYDREVGAVAKTAAKIAQEFCDDLLYIYNRAKGKGWYWFEDEITYCNGIIPQALLAYYSFSGNRNALSIARDSLAFLSDNLFDQGYLNIVGNKGWWQRGEEIPRYDQQPVDACSMVLALKEAYLTTGEKKYLDSARLAREWYSGKNINKTSLYNQESGGCYDALTPEGVNYNQGAEAILSLLYSFQAIEDLEADPEEDGAESKIISGEAHILQEKEQEGFANTPWGRWEVLLDAPDHKVKRITVNPGKRLSYQKHFKRKEHWYVVSGQALVTLDGEDISLASGQSVDIHREAAHRVANPGETPLVFIETQTGSYFGEDDIVRLEDDYGRAE